MKVFQSICEKIIRQRPTIIIFIAFFLFITSNVRAENELTNAASHGDLKTVKALLAQGADVNAKNDEDITALFMACYHGHIDVVKLLIASGADVNIRTKSGNDTPLIIASQNGHTNILKALLEKKPDVNAKNISGATALILASYRGHYDVVKTLLAYGADVKIKTTNDKMTAREAAEKGNHPKIVMLLKNDGNKLTSISKINSQITGIFKDSRDGKIYKTIKIGNQVWMAENLAYKPSSGNFWAYDNDQRNVTKYGYLYDWETAKKVAPKGWHLPAKAEFLALLNNFGGEENREAYNALLKNGESKFNAIFAGYRHRLGKYYNKEEDTGLWSATDSNSDLAWNCFINGNFKSKRDMRFYNYKVVGLSVRLLKD